MPHFPHPKSPYYRFFAHESNRTAWEYNAWAFQCVSGVDTGEACDAVPGQLNLDGVEYDACPDKLLLDFYATGSEGLSHPAVR